MPPVPPRDDRPLERRLGAAWALALFRARTHAEETAPPVSRAPITRSTLVRSDQAHTFDTFVRTLAQWWPVRPYSLGQERVVDVTFTPEPGGRVYETWDDGTTRTWGHVLAWEPPARFAMTWEVFAAHTEVELTFRALGPTLTRVELEHRGWEALSEEEMRTATAAAGGYARGWETVLAALTAHLEENR